MTEENLSCSLNDKAQNQTDLISTSQKEFIKSETGFQNFQELQTWGPAQSLEWNWREAQLKQDLVLESVHIDEQSFGMELSTRVPLSQKIQTSSRIQDWLNSKGIQLCAEQKGKTESLLNALILRKSASLHSSSRKKSSF